MDHERLDKNEFLKLTTEEIRRIVLQRGKPQTGIFVADGNRRFVMTQTGLTPASEDFYPAYVRIVTEYFMKNLTVFFDHGLNTLFFPLFGLSLLKRDERYRQYVMPELIRILFQNDKWLSFYQKRGIRIKSYGNMAVLSQEFGDDRLIDQIKKAETATASSQKHTLFYGLFSNNFLSSSFIYKAYELIKMIEREPSPNELIELYYGEPIHPADLYITSTKIGGLGALPPLIFGKDTKMYALIAPSIFALNERTYRKILYDLLFVNREDLSHTVNDSKQNIKTLREFYQKHQNSVMGVRKRVGKFWVLNDQEKKLK